MNAFDGVRVFSATLARDRETIGERIEQWLMKARQQWPGFRIGEIDVRQSSDDAFHCLSYIIFFKYDVPVTKASRK